MQINKRTRLGGVLVAITTVAAATAMALPAHALSVDDNTLSPCTSVTGNLVVNCGFETPSNAGAVPGWTHLINRGSNVESTTLAHSGSRVLDFYSSGGDDVWTQTIPVAPNTQYLVGAQFYSAHGSAASPLDDITFTATNVAGAAGEGAAIYNSSDADLAWVRGARLVTTGPGHTMTLTLSGSNTPSATYVDDVFALPQRSGCAAIANNAVHNCGFESSASKPSPWVNSVNHDSGLTEVSNGGVEGLDFVSTTADDVWNQTVSVLPHTEYSLTYWADYYSATQTPSNDLTVQFSNDASASGGSLKIATTNVGNKFWGSVTKTFTTGSATSGVLTVSGKNVPHITTVDDFSLTVVPHVKVAAKGRKVTTTLTGLGGQKVLLERLVHKHWVTVHSFIAPKTGSSKSWTLAEKAGRYRAVAQAAPGYTPATSATVTRH
ncbi:MAG TPA: hypothetical protein VHZ06_07975 [Marmoricola sp.]|nr:hypothetical protein [Marmoricola sp.]